MAKYDAMVKLRKDIKLTNEEKAIQAINKLIKNKEETTCQKNADMAEIHRASVYRYERVRKIINQYNERPTLFRSGDSTATLLKLEESRNRQLEKKCKKLENPMESDANYKEQYRELKERLKELEAYVAEEDCEGW